MNISDIPDVDVRQAFEDYPEPGRSRLLSLRKLILETADQTEGVGPLLETLKWGQPSYLTAQTKAGTTVRLGLMKNNPDRCAMFVHCQSGLIEQFRERYPHALTFEGKRAIVLEAGKALPETELRHCIALALTHHLRKKKKR